MGWIVFFLLVAGIAWAIWSINRDELQNDLVLPAVPDPAKGEAQQPVETTQAQLLAEQANLYDPIQQDLMKFARARLTAIPGLSQEVLIGEAGEKGEQLRQVLNIGVSHGHIERAKRKGMYWLYLPISSSAELEQDNEDRYRQHLAHLIHRSKSRGGTRYFNQYVNRCKEEAAARFPKGAAAARKKDGAAAGAIGVIGALLALFG